MKAHQPLLDGLKALPAADQRLLQSCIAAALAALLVGVVFGAATALARGGLLDLGPLAGYRSMSAHAVSIFFFWLYFAQAGLLLVFATVFTSHEHGIEWRRAAWLGLAFMIAGFLASLYGVASGPGGAESIGPRVSEAVQALERSEGQTVRGLRLEREQERAGGAVEHAPF